MAYKYIPLVILILTVAIHETTDIDDNATQSKYTTSSTQAVFLSEDGIGAPPRIDSGISVAFNATDTGQNTVTMWSKGNNETVNEEASSITKPGQISAFPFLGLNITCDLDQLCVSPTRNVSHPMCYCDNECVMFGDCCADWYTTTNNNESETFRMMDNPSHWYDKSATKSGQLKTVSEFMLVSTCLPLTTKTSVRAVTACPDGFGDITLRGKCETGELHPVYNVPVSLRAAGSVQIVYKNIYCATCNGHDAMEVSYWRATAKCPDDMQLLSSEFLQTLMEKCSFALFPPLELPLVRYCLPNHHQVYSDCGGAINVNDTFATICKKYMAPLVSTETHTLYANPHCAICSRGFDFKYSCASRSSERENAIIGPGFGNGRTGLNMFFNFNPDTGSWFNQECEEIKVQYPHKTGCHPLFCPSNTRPSDGLCIDDEFAVYNQTDNMPYDEEGRREYNVTIIIHIEEHVGHNESVVLSYIHQSSFLRRMNQSSIEVMEDYQLINATLLSDSVELNYSVEYYRWTLHLIFSTQHIPIFSYLLRVTTEELKSLRSTPNVVAVTAEVTNFVDPDALHCNDTSIISLRNSDQIKFIGNTTSFVRPTGSWISIDIRNARFAISVDSKGQTRITFVAFCKERLSLGCSLLSYANDEYEIKEARAYINYWTDYVDNFVVKDGMLYVCANDTKGGNIPGDETMQTVTVVMMSVSILFLLALLIIHCRIPSLQTLHGKNLMAFSTCLLIGQSLYLVGSYVRTIPVLCLTIAVAQHYIWLCVFVWNSVMAYDLASKFSAQTMMKAAAKDTNSTFKKYFLIAHGPPLLLVVTCVVLDNTNIPGVDIQYNANADYCWIGNNMASVYAFVIPVGVCLLFNMICFGISMHGIQGTKNITKNVRTKKQERNYCIIYTKISLLIGGTWIITFATAWTNYEPLLYLNICLNGLQGFLLFLGFVVNARVLGLIRKKQMSGSTSGMRSVNSSEMTDISRE